MVLYSIVFRRKSVLWKDLVLLSVLLGGLFVFLLGHRPLAMPGEGRYVEIPREMVASRDFLTPRLNELPYFEKPPLFYWIEAGFIHLFGLQNAFYLRLSTALFALLGCLSLFLFGRAFMGRLAGFWGSFVLGTSFLYFVLARVLVLDLVFTFFLTVALLAFFTATQRQKRSSSCFFIALYGLGMACGVLTKGLIGVVIPGAIVLLWIALTRQGALLKFAFHPIAALVFAIVALPWHIAVCLKNPDFFNFYFIHEHFTRYLTPIHRHDEPIWFFLPIIFLGFFPWISFLPAAVQAFRKKELVLPGHLLSFLWTWFSFIVVFFAFSSSKLIPYILPAFPPLALLVGGFLAYEGKDYERKDLRGSLMVYAILGSLIGLALLGYAPLRNILWNKGYNLPFILPRFGVAVLILWAGVGGVLFYYKKDARKALLSLTSSIFLFLMALAYLDPLFQRVPSIKPMMERLKTHLSPRESVIACGFYPQDVPVYLERTIQVLFYEGEMAFGASITPSQDRLLNTQAFETIWKGPDRAFLILLQKYDKTRSWPAYLKEIFPSLQLHFVDTLGPYNLFTNKP